MDIEGLLTAWMEHHGQLSKKQQEAFKTNYYARQIIKGFVRERWDELEIQECLSKEKKLVELSHLLKRREYAEGKIREFKLANQLKPVANSKEKPLSAQGQIQDPPKNKVTYSKPSHRWPKSKARRLVGNFIGIFFFPIILLIAFTVTQFSDAATEIPSPTPAEIQIESTPTPTPTPTPTRIPIQIPSGPKCDGSGNLIGEWESFYEGQDFRKHPCFISRVGAICMDGWESPATGQGACSHHGGVHYWFDENQNKETVRYK